MICYFWIFLPVCITSVILLLILYKRHGMFHSFWQMDIPKLTGPTILMSILTPLLLLKIFTNWAAALSTWGTLLLASAAFLAIRNSTTQGQRHRQAELDRENQDRKDRQLNEIIGWAMDIAKCESLSQVPLLPVLGFKIAGKALAEAFIAHSERVSIANLGLRYQAIDARSENMKIIAMKLDKSLGSDLNSAVCRTAQKLDKHLKIIEKQIRGAATAEEYAEEYKEHWLTLVESAKALAKKAISLTE